jgi:hypothetical protein
MERLGSLTTGYGSGADAPSRRACRAAPANQDKPNGERHDAEDHQQRHEMTTTTQAAVDSSNSTVVVHIAPYRPPLGGRCSPGRSWRSPVLCQAALGQYDKREIYGPPMATLAGRWLSDLG